MMEWAKDKGLLDLPTTRCFGFNNPDPSPERSTYGYEVWVTVPDGIEPSGSIKIKDFAGGLYAVATTRLYEIGERWQALGRWVNESKDYGWGRHQWLEETVIPDVFPDRNSQLDLMAPIHEV
jgi:DNA gyrase inhibitor GyrI